MSESEPAAPPGERRNPFVGPRPLRGGEPLFGRDRELNQLTNLVMAERIVLLHSPSGAGKTSLIHAGLIPRLTLRGFHSLPVIRVNLEAPASQAEFSDRASRPNRYLFSTLLSLEEDLPEDQQLTLERLTAMSLADYLAARVTDTALLIFDQFEEILTLDPTDREAKEAFFEQVGQALGRRDLYALFAMREDFVPALQPYLLPVPTRLVNTYRLDLLDKKAAQQVTQKTALQGGVTFTDTAASQLVDDLSRVQVQQPDGSLEFQPGTSIEPVQLQVVCFNLWEKLDPEQNEIDATALMVSGNVDQSLAEYYALQVAAAAQKTGLPERRIREWLESALITARGVRGQVLREPERSQGLENSAIQLLVDAHLVRAEARRGSTWFELTHDRLVHPIREDNAIWFATHLSLLQRQAAVWDEQERPDGLLLRKGFLTDARKWADENPDDLTNVERAFLTASQQAEAHEAAQESLLAVQILRMQEQQQHLAQQQRANRRLRLLLVTMIVVTLAAIAAGVLAVSSRQAAVVQRSLAETNAFIAGANAETATVALGESQRRGTAVMEQAATATIALGESQLRGTEAARQQSLAEMQARRAMAGELVTRARASFENDPEIALLHAAQAVDIHLQAGEPPLAAALETLHAALGEPASRNLEHMVAQSSRIAFSPDGRWLASGGDAESSCVICLLDLSDPAAEPIALQGPENMELVYLVFSPDGRWLSAWGEDGTVYLSDITRPAQAAAILPDVEPDLPMATFSPDSRRLAIADGDHVRLWELGNLAADPTVLQADEPLFAPLAFSPAGQHLAAVQSDGSILYWDLQAQDYRRLLPPGETQFGWLDPYLEFSEDGRWLVVSDSYTAWTWDTQDLEAAPLVLAGREDAGMSLIVNAGKTYLHQATEVADHTESTLWDLSRPADAPQVFAGPSLPDLLQYLISPNGRWQVENSSTGKTLLKDVEKPLADPYTLRQPGFTTAIKYSPDSRWLASIGEDNILRLWNLDQLGLDPIYLHGVDQPVGEILFSPEGRWLTTGDYAQPGILAMWDLQDRQPFSDTRLLSGHTDFALPVGFSPDGQRLISVSQDRTARIWQLDDLAPQPASLDLGSLENFMDITEVWSAVSPDFRWLARSGDVGQVLVWDIARPAVKPLVLSGQDGTVFEVQFSPDGRWLASSSIDNTLYLWKTGDWAAQPIILKGPRVGAPAIGFSPDGRWLAFEGPANDALPRVTGSSIRLLDLSNPTVAPLRLQVDFPGPLADLVFSPGGRWLAANSPQIYVFDTQTWQARQWQSYASNLVFSPDERWLAGIVREDEMSPDQSIVLWNITSIELGPVYLRGIEGALYSLAFSPDGRWLASSGADGVRLWTVRPEDLLHLACLVLHGKWEAVECQQDWSP